MENVIKLNDSQNQIEKAVKKVKDGKYNIIIPIAYKGGKPNWDNLKYIGKLIEERHPGKSPWDAGRWDWNWYPDWEHSKDYRFIIDMTLDEDDYNCDNLVYDWKGYDWRKGSEIGWAVKGTPDYALCVQAYIHNEMDMDAFDDAMDWNAWGWLPVELLEGTYQMTEYDDE